MVLCRPKSILFRSEMELYRPESFLRGSEGPCVCLRGLCISLRGFCIRLKSERVLCCPVSVFRSNWPYIGLRELSVGLGGPSVDMIESYVDSEITLRRPKRALCRPKDASVELSEDFTPRVAPADDKTHPPALFTALQMEEEKLLLACICPCFLSAR